MIEKRFSRLAKIIGENGVCTLKKKRVLLFGCGGVGGILAEALCRSGVGAIDLVDFDTVSESNINRQVVALFSTIGQKKTEVLKKRLLDINPSVSCEIFDMFFLPENSSEIDFFKYDYIIDAVDTVSAKIEIIKCAKKANVPVICAMGAGNKLSATSFVCCDIFKTSVCPLARVMRHELKRLDIKDVKVVFSTEKAHETLDGEKTPGSAMFAVCACSMVICENVIKDLLKGEKNEGCV